MNDNKDNVLPDKGWVDNGKGANYSHIYFYETHCTTPFIKQSLLDKLVSIKETRDSCADKFEECIDCQINYINAVDELIERIQNG